MSASPPQHNSVDRRDNHEHGANGFTAVNGRISPPSARQQVHTADDSRPNGETSKVRSPMQYNQDRHVNGISNSDRPPRANHGEPQRTPSPQSAALKRRRSGSTERYNGDTGDLSSRRVDFDDRRPHVYAHEPPRERNIPWRPQHDGLDEPETRLREALQNDVDDMNGTPHSHGGYDDDHRAGHGDMSPDNADDWINTKAGVKVNPGKRKRAFTNRTKTGCQTCRRRKKKCDEQKPECQNCLRGGFMCEGYNQQKVFAKATPPKGPPMAIQAKDAYGDPAVHYPRPDARTSMTFGGTPQHQPPRHYEDDVHESGRSSYSSTHYDNHRGYVSREPSHDTATGVNGINHNTPNHYPSHIQLQAQRALSYPSPANTGSTSNHGSGPSPSGPSSSSSRPPMQQQQQQQQHSNKKPEKDKMIHGEEYHPLDPQLTNERENCRRLLDTYNTSFVSPEERQRQLRAILEPDAQTPGGPSHNYPSPLGQRVHVGIPFRCDYGHRIQLQDDVNIESGCVIQDAKEVRISRGTYIGANVQIISKAIPFHHTPPVRGGPGPHGPRGVIAKGIPIHIGENVVIGAGCIIAPDYDDKNGILTIGAGAYIMPGTVVREDVKPNQLYGVSSRDGPQVLGDVSSRAPPPSSMNQHPPHPPSHPSSSSGGGGPPPPQTGGPSGGGGPGGSMAHGMPPPSSGVGAVY